MHKKRIARSIIGGALFVSVLLSPLHMTAGNRIWAATGQEEAVQEQSDVSTFQVGQAFTPSEGSYYIIYDAYDDNGNPLDGKSSSSRFMFDNGGVHVGWLKYDNGYLNKYSSNYLWKFTSAESDGTYYMRSQSASTAFGVLNGAAVANNGNNGGGSVISAKDVRHPGSPMKLEVMAVEDGKTYVAIRSVAYHDAVYGELNAEKYMTTDTNGRGYVIWQDTIDRENRSSGWWVVEKVMDENGVMPGGSANRTLLWRTKPMHIHYRIPALATTNRGDLIAVADYRYDSSADIGTNWTGWNGENYNGFGSIGHRIDQVSKISQNNGADWSEEKNLTSQWSFRGTDAGNLSNGYGDPAIVADRNSDKVLLMSVGGSYGFFQNNAGVVSMLSTDGGKNFSAPKAMGGRTTGTGTTTQENYTTGLYALGNQSGFRWTSLFLTSGRIMQSRYIRVGDHYRIYCAAVVRVTGTGAGYYNWVFYSDNFGKTWDVLPGPAIQGADEAKVDELPNGSVVISTRMAGGRKINVFTYNGTDTGYKTGSWGEQAELRIGNQTNATNGELYIIYAKNNENGKYGYLALQTFPAAADGTRSEVRIFYKWLDESIDTPQEFASGWSKENSYLLQQNWSAYSVMTMQADGKLGAMWEEGNSYYDLVYQSISIDELTQNKYSAAFSQGLGTKDMPYVAKTADDTEAILTTYEKECVNWTFEGEAKEYLHDMVSKQAEGM